MPIAAHFAQRCHAGAGRTPRKSSVSVIVWSAIYRSSDVGIRGGLTGSVGTVELSQPPPRAR